MLRKGMILGERYEIIEQVGSGGMSDVYKAKCHKLNRFVAIKVLKQEFSEDKNFLTKFKVEAQSVAGLTHPNIVNIYDVGSENGLSYIVMEYIEGITLKRYIERKGQLGVREAVSIAIQVAQGIEAAHNNQIVHRDIKPQNILISKEGKVKVTDFGIARAASANTISSNTAMGSVHYISPEQARGGFVDERSDIYSLGITLFEMITGKFPFDGDSTVTIALKHIQDDMPRIENFVDGVPVSVKKIIEKCTQKKADRRYLKISSLISDLKKSLLSPDEDFVQLIPISNTASTVMISDEEVSAIRKETGSLDGLYDDDDRDGIALVDNNDDLDLEEGIDEVNPKLDKLITIGAIVAGVVILVIFILLSIKFLGGINGFSSGKNKQSTEATVSTVTVPDLTGMKEDEIKAKLKELNLGVYFEYVINNEIEEGLAISQSIEADTEVEKNKTIEVVISKGKETIEMPDLIGKTKDEAIKILTEKGLKNTVVTDFNDNHALDIVFQTEPSSAENLKYGDNVIIHVSRGSEVTEVTVPNLYGLAQNPAVAALSQVGLELGNVRYEESELAKGTVIGQSREAFSKIDKGSKIDIVLAKEIPPKTAYTHPITNAEIVKYVPDIKNKDNLLIKIIFDDGSEKELEKVVYSSDTNIASKSFVVDRKVRQYQLLFIVNGGTEISSEDKNLKDTP